MTSKQNNVNSESSIKSSEISAPLLEIKDLQIEFTTGTGKEKQVVKAVDGVSFVINKGERVAIVGESGSGKSTTAHSIINLLPGSGKVVGGSIKFEGSELVGKKDKEFVQIRGSKIGLVPQDPMSNLNPVWKIGFQVEEAIRANSIKGKNGSKLNRKEVKEKAKQLLIEAGLNDVEIRAKQYPHEFSGGMRQRVLIAIGLAGNPQLLIADEPTSALDVTVQKVILDHLETLTNERETSVLFITHDLGLAADRSDKIVVMYKGKVVEVGPSVEILKNPQHPYTQKLIAAAPSLASKRIKSTKSSVINLNGEKLTKKMKSAFENAHSQNEPVFEGDNIIEVHDVSKEFEIRGKKEKLLAVDNVSFAIPRGTTTAIVGESGSGKSTVANMILGLLPVTNGRISVEGTDLKEILKNKNSTKKFRENLQPVFQNPYGSLDPLYSIGRSIEEPLLIHSNLDRQARQNRVAELLDLVGLPVSVTNRYPNELSGGQRQRIAIARAIALNPEMVVLDEAVSALDVLVQQQILTLLNDLQAQLNLTYLFITHDLAVVRLIADSTIVMQNGKIVERGLTQQLFDNPATDYTRNLLDAIPGKKLL